jgi:hypothetical protein
MMVSKNHHERISNNKCLEINFISTKIDNRDYM